MYKEVDRIFFSGNNIKGLHKSVDVTGTINTNLGTVEVNCNGIVGDRTSNYGLGKSINVQGSDGYNYSIYGLSNGILGYTNRDRQMYNIKCRYSTVVKEQDLNSMYNGVSIEINGIEKIIDCGDNIKTLYEGDSIHADIKNNRSYKSKHGIKYEISTNICKMDVNDTKLVLEQVTRIKIIFTEYKSIVDILDHVDAVKKLLEWKADLELEVTNIVFFEINKDTYMRESELVYYHKYTKDYNANPRRIEWLREENRWSMEDFLKCIDSWLFNYKRFRGAIELWSKVIYNWYSSGQDRFLWYCQSLELLCKLSNIENLAIETMSVLHKRKRKTTPNLKYLMQEIEKKYELESAKISDLDCIVACRNYVVHSLLDATPNIEQKGTAYSLVAYYFDVLLTKECELDIKIPDISDYIG